MKSAVNSSNRNNNSIAYGVEGEGEYENVFKVGRYMMTEIAVLNPRPGILVASIMGPVLKCGPIKFTLFTVPIQKF